MILEHVVKINYILDIPFTETLKAAYDEFVEETDQIEKGYKNLVMERFFRHSVEDILEGIRAEYPDYDGKFVLEIRNDRVKGVFKSAYQVKARFDEPMRREFFDRFKKLCGSDDLRVEINMNCMI